MSKPDDWMVNAAIKIRHGDHTHLNAENYRYEFESVGEMDNIRVIDYTAALIQGEYAAKAPKVDVDVEKLAKWLMKKYVLIEQAKATGDSVYVDELLDAITAHLEGGVG